MPISRRTLLHSLFAGLMLPHMSFAGQARIDSMFRDNFRFIYGNAERRKRFFPFLKNVFHLFPEHEFDQLIANAVDQKIGDSEIYRKLAAELPDLQPVFANLRFALPALGKQKDVMQQQTVQLLGDRLSFDSYLEFGSGGRYLDTLEERVDIAGDRFLVLESLSGYSPVDIVDRGQLVKAGTEIDLENYAVDLIREIGSNSIDFATVYIGFHHCPLALRDDFFAKLHAVMKPGGILIVRDHDAHDEIMQHLVALAHDVFNLGTNESWQYNENEFRAFYSLESLAERLGRHGFRHDGRFLFQDGDPTRNALMIFIKT